ncbi:YbjN domain-containing protein [Brevundimonas sp. VNH65]|uniref:YbjN domain-containing protein n=1 Tax=Brevundimonas sp. VNH65 TaxID=3400917 RepID=UPI003C0156C9
MKQTLVLSACLAGLLATSVQAQTTPPAAQTPAAPAAAGSIAPTPSPLGVSTAALSAWLTSQGATVAPEASDDGRRYLRVTTDGLPWLIFLQSCETDVCSDLQFSAALSDASITLDKVNVWNRDRRFVKAIYEPAETGGVASAVAQFDVLVGAGGPGQLTDHLAVWRALLADFVRTLMPRPAPAAAPTPAPTPAAPPAGN